MPKRAATATKRIAARHAAAYTGATSSSPTLTSPLIVTATAVPPASAPSRWRVKEKAIAARQPAARDATSAAVALGASLIPSTKARPRAATIATTSTDELRHYPVVNERSVMQLGMIGHGRMVGDMTARPPRRGHED